jgi:hypothetical protein
MITTCLTLAGMLGFVLFPLFIPTTVHAVDAVVSWRRNSAPARTAGYSRLALPRRLAVAAA